MLKKVIPLLAFLLLTSCQAAPVSSDSVLLSSQAFHVEYTDASGYTTTFTKKPENVAVLFSSYAQIWSLVGGEIKVTVGDSIKRGFASEGTTLVNDGAGLKIDSEILLASHPDLVITTFDFSAQVKVATTCREEGINVLQLKEESFEDYLSILSLFASLNENKTAYQQYGLNVQSEIESIKAKSHENKDNDYLFIRAGNAFASTKIQKTEDHFACKIFNDLGASNLADSLAGLTNDVSLENIIMADPDKLIVVPQGDAEVSKQYVTSLFQEEGYSTLTAVKNNQVYFVDKELFHYKPNQRWAESYDQAFDLLYGE